MNEDRLNRIEEMAEENNRLLRKLVSASRWARFFRILYWAVIIGSMFGTYYLLQPLLSGLLDAYSELTSGVGALKETGGGLLDSLNNIRNILPR